MGALKKVLKQLGTPKNAIKTDDKLSRETKELISRRTAIRQKITLTGDERSELITIKKLTMKKIKEDVYNYEREIANSIIESTWSTRQTRKLLVKANIYYPE